MSESKDYGEPLTIMADGAVYDANGVACASYDEETTERLARRMVVCLNACAGIDPAAALAAAREALEAAQSHVLELEDAWARGVLSEHDGKGGTRSNRNIVVRNAVAAALSLLAPKGKETT